MSEEIVLIREALVLMREALVLIREAIVLMREALVRIREAIVLMREAIVLNEGGHPPTARRAQSVRLGLVLGLCPTDRRLVLRLECVELSTRLSERGRLLTHSCCGWSASSSRRV